MGYTAPPPHKSLTTDSDSQIPIDYLFNIQIYKLRGQWLGTRQFLRGLGVFSAFSYRCKTLKNHIFLLNQANGLVFGRHMLILKSYKLSRMYFVLFCIAMVTVCKESLSMGSNINNNVISKRLNIVWWWNFGKSCNF